MTGKITGELVYNVLTSLVPLYVPMFAAYVSVRWWKILTPEQCSGVNVYVSCWVIPFLTFKFISESNPYTMNFWFLGADAVQKVLVLIFGLLAHTLIFSRRRNDSFDWVITIYSLCTLPNTLVIGIPLFQSFYGTYAGQLMVQIVFLQSILWFNSLLILYEYRAAIKLISTQFPDTAEHIASFRVDPDIVSLCDVNEEVNTCLTEVDENGNLHVSMRRRSSAARSFCLSRQSDFSGVEIYSKNSSVRERPSFSDQVSRKSDVSTMNKSGTGSIHMFLWNSSTKYLPTIISSKDSTTQTEGKIFPAAVNESQGKLEDGTDGEKDETVSTKMASQTLMMKLAITMTWRKLSRNPTTYATLLGLIWSLIANSSLQIQMPAIIKASYQIISAGGIGMMMFSLGTFMGLQEKLIPCGIKLTALAMIVRFVVSPVVIALTSLPFGLRGDFLRIAILQAALPQSTVAFVFAKEYDVHPGVLSTSVIVGMLIALPISFLYFILLEF